MTIILSLLSLLGPVLVGVLIVRRMWQDAPIPLRLGLGAALGTGLYGTLYFLTLLLFDSARLSFTLTEVIGALIVVLYWKGGSVPVWKTKTLSSSGFAWTVIVTAIIAGVAFFFALDASSRGGWDAFVMWNLKARLIATSQASPLSAIFDPALSGLHPDYPLLLPALVSRGWQYAGANALTVPVILAALFTVVTIVIVVSGLRIVSTNAQSWIAGCVLLGTPFLLSHGASQYADIVICCFMTSAMVLYCVYDAGHTSLQIPFLAGILAAAAACTKNEGILFLILLVLARCTVALMGKSGRSAWTELLRFGSGASLGLVTLASFKLLHAPPNDTMPLMAVNDLWLRIVDSKRNLDVLRGMGNSLNFGRWLLNPLPLIAVHAAVTWKSFPDFRPAGRVPPWFTGAFVALTMIFGVYGVNLLSPYDVESHVESSFDRVLLQLWPSIIIVYSMVSAPQGSTVASWKITLSLVFRLAALLAVAFITVWSFNGSRPEPEAQTKPSIRLSRTEVTTGDVYTMTITGLAGPQVFVSYELDGKPMGQFGAYIGTDGRVDFQVSASTWRGTYRFLAVRSENSSSWIDFENSAAIRVK